jgi:septum formation protein
MEVILASASPRRKVVLQELGFHVVQHPMTGIDERPPIGVNVKSQVESICRRKAEGFKPHTDQIVIVADTMIEHPNDMFQSIGKPMDANHANEILLVLSNQTHKVWTVTGVSVYGEWKFFIDFSVVFIPQLEPPTLKVLLDSASWKGKAGAYDLQGQMGEYAELKEGHESTVLGISSSAIEYLHTVVHEDN